MSQQFPYRKRAILSLMISAVLTSHAAYAQDDSDVYQQLEMIQVEATATEVGETLIDLEEIQRLSPNDLQDLFRGTPSVQVGSSLPISQKVYVNGIEETNLSVTVDGARQNNKLFHHSSTNIIDPELLKTVRVDAGVAPADAGPGALGGSLAYETKDVSDLLTEGDNFGGAIGLEYNTNGNTFDRNISMYGRSGGFEALGFLKKAEGSEFEDGDGNDVLFSDAALTTGLVKLAYLHDSGYRTKVSFERVEDDSDRIFRANFAGRFTGDTVSQRYQLERETVVFSIKNDTPTGLLNPYIKLAQTDTELATGPLNRGEYTSINGLIANEFVLGLGTVDAGLDFYDDSSKGIFPAFSSVVEEKSKNVGLFAQARLSPSERVRLSFGARYDQHELEGVDGSDHDNDGLSSNISGEFDVTPYVTASAGYSHVFGGVQLAEPYIANAAWDYSAGLKEAKANNSFVALSLNAEGLNAALAGLTLAVKVFKTDLSNIRDEEYSGGPDIYSDIESDGFEVSGRYDWQSGFFRVSYIDSDTDINGLSGTTESQYIGTSIGRVIKADIAHTFDNLGVTVGADVQRYFAEDGNNIYATPSHVEDAFPAYTVANTFLEYTPQAYKGLMLRASVNNLFDEAYADRASYGQEYVMAYDTQILQEPGRSFVLSAKLKF